MRDSTQMVSFFSLILVCGCGVPQASNTAAADVGRSEAEAHGAGIADSLWVELQALALVGFYPGATDSLLKDDPDLNEVLADFEYHLGSAMTPLRALGFVVEVRTGDTLHLRAASRSWHWARDRDSSDVGYYLTDSTGRSRVVYGVYTNSDLVALADSFARSRVP